MHFNFSVRFGFSFCVYVKWPKELSVLKWVNNQNFQNPELLKIKS